MYNNFGDNVLYLDFSATTPVDKRVLNKFIKDNEEYIGNANSSHCLGKNIANEILATSKNILTNLGLDDSYEVVYTSGSSEANNLAITGFINKFDNKNICLITTPFEHSSIIAPSSFHQKEEVKVEFVNILENGLIDINHLKKLIEVNNDMDGILVSIASVNSEIGLLQNIQEIKNVLNSYPKVIFHCDATQSLGKIKLDYKDIDMLSFSAHKFYGLKGIGALVKKKNIKLEPLIKGGKSTTKFRSGTPAHPLIFSLGYALNLATTELNARIEKVEDIYKYLISKLNEFSKIELNSNAFSIPHIVNFSVLGYSSFEIVTKLSEKEIYISNHSACASDKELSLAVMNLTKSYEKAISSVRISLSHLTTKNEIDYLIQVLKEIIE